MLEPQTMDELERKVGVAELELSTMEAAGLPDATRIEEAQWLEGVISRALETDDSGMAARSHLAALKARATSIKARLRVLMEGYHTR